MTQPICTLSVNFGLVTVHHPAGTLQLDELEACQRMLTVEDVAPHLERLTTQRDDLLRELEATVAWLNERVQVLGNIHIVAPSQREALAVETARLRARAVVINQTVLKVKGELS